MALNSSPCEQVNQDLNAIQQKIRASLPRQVLEPWIQLQPARVYQDITLSWLGIFCTLVCIAWLPQWWTYGLGIVGVGLCQYALFILGHDALHYSLHPNRSTNDQIARWLIYSPLFMGLEDGRKNHLQHHRHLATKFDPDRYIHSLENKNTRIKFILFCSGLATFGKTVLKVTPFKSFSVSRTELEVKNGVNSEETPFQTLAIYFQQRAAILVIQPSIITLLLILGLPWWAYGLLWIAPIYFFVFLPDELRAFCDHAVSILPDQEADTSRLITFRPSKIESVLFSPHNMNYHAEHHLFPAIPYYNLPQVHQIVKNRAEVTVHNSYLMALVKIIISLPL